MSKARQDPAWYRGYYARNRERILARMKSYSTRPDVRARRRTPTALARDAAYAKRRDVRPGIKTTQSSAQRGYYARKGWETRLMQVYGLKEGEYAERLAAQGGVCAICGKKPGRIRLAVDHDHSNGKVRGLLHSRCNRALGPLEHDEATLERAVIYLTRALELKRSS